jgi:outer membrane lipoprotein-sorting protein
MGMLNILPENILRFQQYTMRIAVRLVFFVLYVFVGAFQTNQLFAQQTADDLALQLEQKLFSGEAIRMKFSLGSGEKVEITTDVKRNRVRIESTSITLVSDGTTVWNYSKRNKQVTIDGASSNPNSAIQKPQDLFRFSSNYAVSIVKHTGNEYTLELIPNERIQALFKSAGGLSSILLTVIRKSAKSITIKRATAQSKAGRTETGALKVESIKKLSSTEFVFKTPEGAKTVDLRE